MIASARPAVALDTLRSQFTGNLHAPGDAGYDDARMAWNLAVDQRPVLVAEPRTADDIAAVVRFARQEGLRVAPQGTGHNAAARAGVDESILLSTRLMRGVEIDFEGRSRPRRGRRALRRPDGAGLRAGPGRAGGLLARRRPRRLHARRRHGLAGARLRLVLQLGPVLRRRHRRRRAAARRRRQPPGAVLGAARRHGQPGGHHAHGAAADRHARALRRRDAVAVGAGVRGPARVARVDAGRARDGHDVGAHRAGPAAAGHPGDAARSPVRRDRRRRARLRRLRQRGARPAARAGAGDRHVRRRPAGRAQPPAHGPRASGPGHRRPRAAERRDAGADRRHGRGRRPPVRLAADGRRAAPPRRRAVTGRRPARAPARGSTRPTSTSPSACR